MAFTAGNNPFSSAFCSALLRFYGLCYRHGLEDAAASGDAGECEEAAQRLKDVRRYGTVDCEMDWNEWQFKSLQWTRVLASRGRIMDLVMSLRRPGHKLGFLMQVAKMYYMRGIRDWLECRDWLDARAIEGLPAFPYLLKRARGYRSSTRGERFEQLQGECFNLISLQELWRGFGGDFEVPASRVRAFVERVWAAMQSPKWFDEYDLDDDCVDGLNPTEGVSLGSVACAESYTMQDKGKKKNKAGDGRKEKTDRRVPRKDAGRGDAPADGAVLQQGAPKRKRGRPPKNV